MSSLDAIDANGLAQATAGPRAAESSAPEPSTAGPRTAGPETIVRLGIAAFALYFWAAAGLMAFAPRFFFAHVGPFGVRNDHYIRDTATFNAAFGAGLAAACWRSSWRVPVLCCATIQFALHAANHLLDIDNAHPHWLGLADFATLALSAVLLAGLLRQASKRPAVGKAKGPKEVRT